MPLQKFNLLKLKDETRQYLDGMTEQRGRGYNSRVLFLPAQTSEYLGAFFLISFAAVPILGFFLFFYFSFDFAESGPTQGFFVHTPRPKVTAALAGVLAYVAMLVASLLVRRSFRREKAPIRDMVMVDGRGFWRVKGRRLQHLPLREISQCEGTHHHQNGVYTGTHISIKADNGRSFIATIPDKEHADAFFGDLQTYRQVAAKLPAAAAEEIGALASAVTDRLPEPQLRALGPRIPEPSEGTSARRFGAHRIWTIPLLVFGLCYPVIHRVNSHRNHGHLYAAAKAEDSEFKACDKYLESFPNGRHADEVLALRDDRAYEQARLQSAESESPRGLRDYLTDERNQRHREEAQQQINVFYDRAISRVKGLAEAEGVHRDLHSGMLTLLDAMKTRPLPVATVGFQGTQTATPSNLVERLEKLQYIAYLEDHRELRAMDKRSAGGALISTGAIFEPSFSRAREEAILSRLRKAMEKVLDADLIQLQASKSPDEADLLVSYSISPSGSLFMYTRTASDKKGSSRDSVQGLLRSFQVGWEIRVRPTGSDRHFTWEIDSSPADSMSFQRRPGQPDWVPYSVILYSAFVDMSNRLIQGFGLEPPLTPTYFTYSNRDGVVPGSAAKLREQVNREYKEKMDRLIEEMIDKAKKHQ